ncbi:hypothetical protein [Pseudoteredinibacter isoporae]|uniref:hypothetical protein n=1 Tax=Pseudoteredinibacter isoporae TaxID=570281 RepID=UPI0031051C02
MANKRIIGGEPADIVAPEMKEYLSYNKVDFIKAVGIDVVNRVRRSTVKQYVFIRELLDASNHIDFNEPTYRDMLMAVSADPEAKLSVERAVEIMGAPHDGVAE